MPERGRDGFYRCPNKCSNPDYPQRKWKTEKGFNTHMETCRPEPPVLVWVPEAKGGPRKWSECPDCGATIWEMTSIWWMHDRVVCVGCFLPYYEAGIGHMDCAGLTLPGMALEG